MSRSFAINAVSRSLNYSSRGLTTGSSSRFRPNGHPMPRVSCISGNRIFKKMSRGNPVGTSTSGATDRSVCTSDPSDKQPPDSRNRNRRRQQNPHAVHGSAITSLTTSNFLYQRLQSAAGISKSAVLLSWRLYSIVLSSFYNNALPCSEHASHSTAVPLIRM